MRDIVRDIVRVLPADLLDAGAKTGQVILEEVILEEVILEEVILEEVEAIVMIESEDSSSLGKWIDFCVADG